VNGSPKTFFTTRPVGDVVVLDIEGELSLTTSPVPTLHDLVKNHLEMGKRNILFNFEKVGFVDTFGVGQMISSYISTQNLGGRFKLCRLSDKLVYIFHITGLIKVFDIYPTEEAALESFAKPPKSEA
jgi:anti-sigma B factor antagonist